jgi:hypothetical protein
MYPKKYLFPLALTFEDLAIIPKNKSGKTQNNELKVLSG